MKKHTGTNAHRQVSRVVLLDTRSNKLPRVPVPEGREGSSLGPHLPAELQAKQGQRSRDRDRGIALFLAKSPTHACSKRSLLYCGQSGGNLKKEKHQERLGKKNKI